MSDQNLKNLQAAPVVLPNAARPPIGQCLLNDGVISKQQLDTALSRQGWLRAPLGEILVAEGSATRAEVTDALSRQHGVQAIALNAQNSDPKLGQLRDAEFWLRHGVLPWIRIGDTVLVATSRPDQFDAVRADLETDLPVVLPVLATPQDIQSTIATRFETQLAKAASARVADQLSFRSWRVARFQPLALCLLAATLIGLLLFPRLMISVATLTAVLTLVLFTGLKISGLICHLRGRYIAAALPSDNVIRLQPLPKISMLVPLYQERAIATRLVENLSKLDYPKALLDVVLVLEADDLTTQKALEDVALPVWMRKIIVPKSGPLTTKPRAMNYALDFCRGDLIGIWDAEDAPAPDQLTRVARRFARLPDDVVCLQGVLDFYNPYTNWLSRCFSIEYASWFRIVLNGIAKLGLVVPLGGTTLFMRRAVLEQLGGWDAHNVTEDADLGVRIYRAGLRTQLIDTTTYEEANCRTWPWIKQRSRWLKGFMVTYLVHMRRPAELWRDLGVARFLGFQAFFLGTLGQFLLAPVLWSFWLVAFGLPHPAEAFLGRGMLVSFSVALVAFEILSFTISVAAARASGRAGLIPYALTMSFYFVLGTIAAYKALYELIRAPFFWDKTEHGHEVPDQIWPVASGRP